MIGAWRLAGETTVIFHPLELLEKLSALVPAPKAHLIRYSGILAPAAKWRALVVPASAPESAQVSATDMHDCALGSSSPNVEEPDASAPHGRNYTWAELMKRVWSLDVLECPRCFGRMRILAAIHSPEALEKILTTLGLPSRAPPVAAAVSESIPQIESF